MKCHFCVYGLILMLMETDDSNQRSNTVNWPYRCVQRVTELSTQNHRLQHQQYQDTQCYFSNYNDNYNT